VWRALAFTSEDQKGYMLFKKLLFIQVWVLWGMLIFLAAQAPLHAQQFLIGFRGGPTFSAVKVNESHSILQWMVPPDEGIGIKQYPAMFQQPIGNHFGISFDFEFGPYFGIVLEPSYVAWQFQYSQQLAWQSAEFANRFVSINYQHSQTLRYVELPLQLRWNILPRKVSPYIQAGGVYQLLIDARKSVDATVTDAASGGIRESRDQFSSIGVEDQFRPSLLGLTGTVGVAFHFPFMRLGLDCTYRYYPGSITSEGNRFRDGRVMAAGFDVFDDLSLTNLHCALVCHFPINFTMAPGAGRKGIQYVVPYDLRMFKNKRK
jgi:hypothetical protein